MLNMCNLNEDVLIKIMLHCDYNIMVVMGSINILLRKHYNSSSFWANKSHIYSIIDYDSFVLLWYCILSMMLKSDNSFNLSDQYVLKFSDISINSDNIQLSELINEMWI